MGVVVLKVAEWNEGEALGLLVKVGERVMCKEVDTWVMCKQVDT